MATGDQARLDDPLIGRTIADKFRLRACVGVGASGAVYKADQIALGRTVAIKMLNPELAADPRLVDRFQDEALAASRLNHPNTVSIIDYGQTVDGLLYLAMEFLAGHTLTQVLQRDFPLDPDWIADVVDQILAGLEEAHAEGVVHADLKSDNIVIARRRGGQPLAKVVDFGIARIIGAPRTEPGERSICGTPEYMAPEVIGGAAPTFASDLYAVGVILYELLVGATPFVGGSAVDVLTRHIYDEPVPPSKRRPSAGVDPALEALALRALAKKPADRFADTGAFRAALAGRAAATPAPEAEARVVCASCGAASPRPFKFCPECGQPAQPLRTTLEIPSLAADATARTQADLSVDPALRSSAADGLLPLPLLGRDAELDTLLRFLLDSGPAVMQVLGDSGTGRSRLIRTAYERLAEVSHDVTIHHAGPDPSGLAATLYPIRAVVASVLALPPLCPYEALGEALVELGLSHRDLPGIAELFGHETDLVQLEAPVRKRELTASVVRVLRAAGSRDRTVLVFEDIDRYDQPSQELLRRIAERTEAHPLRVLLSCGPELAARWAVPASRIELGPLGAPELVEVAEKLAGAGATAATDGEVLMRLTEGSPARLTQLVRYLLEGGALEGAPESLGDLIAARLALLPHECLQLCQAAAVFGVEVEAELLGGLFAGLAPAADLRACLETAEARGLIHREGGFLGFTSSLVREIVYDATPADVRRALHQAAAEALAGTGAGPAILGHHAERAGHRRRAAELLMRGGDDAVRQLDDTGAGVLYQRALAAARVVLLADQEPEDRTRFVQLSVRLADVLRVGGELGLARGIVDEARSYCAETPALEAQLLRAAAHLSLTEGDTAAAIRAVRRAIGLAIASGHLDSVAELYLDLSQMLLRNGESLAALAELEEGIDLLTLGGGGASEHGPEALWQLLLRMAQIASGMTRSLRALELGQQALAHARRVHSRVGIARAQTLLASVYDAAGDSVEADRCRQLALEEMRKLGDRRGTAELLLAGVTPTRTLMRIVPKRLAEAAALADEVGWHEGADLARRHRD